MNDTLRRIIDAASSRGWQVTESKMMLPASIRLVAVGHRRMPTVVIEGINYDTDWEDVIAGLPDLIDRGPG